MEISNETRLTPGLDRFLLSAVLFFLRLEKKSLSASNSQARNKTNFYRSSSNKKELHNEMEIKPNCLKSLVTDPCQKCFFIHPTSIAQLFAAVFQGSVCFSVLAHQPIVIGACSLHVSLVLNSLGMFVCLNVFDVMMAFTPLSIHINPSTHLFT